MESKQSLYLKYRPVQLNDLVGQKHIVATLKQASINDEFAHAYLFSGNHGCGKTSSARILASLLTCENVKDGAVCGECRACKTIHAGVALDVKELDGATSRGIDDIKTLIDGAQWSPQELKRKVYILDECLGKDSRVETENGLIPISQIVNQKNPIKVKSYNESSKKIEYKEVTAYHKNSGKDIYKLHFEGLGVLYAAENHKVMTPHGWKKVKDLEVGQEVCRHQLNLNECQEQVALGSLLGDASLSRNQPRSHKLARTNTRLKFVHGHKQYEYIKWKLEQFQCFSLQKQPHINKIGGFAKKPTSSVSTQTSSIFNRLQDITNTNGKKTVTRQWLDKIGPIAMAIWFCDDGSLNRISTQKGISNYVTLHTQGFSKNENDLIRMWLVERWGINSSVLPVKNGLFIISISKEGSDKFLDIISEYVPSSMKQKLKNFNEDKSCSFWDTYENKNEIGLVPEKITIKEFVRYESNTYDLEVEGNHNYFVSGTLVHNCHQLTKEATSALLKILEEPPSYLTFILCTTEIKKILPTILSRCQRFNFGKIASKEISARLKYIADKEKINIEEDAIHRISLLARGGMRDAVGYLEQIGTVAADKAINKGHVQKYFGVSGRDGILNIIKSMVSGNIPMVLDQINDMIMASADTRDIMVLKANNGETKLTDLPDTEIVELNKIGEAMKLSQLLKLAHLFSDIERKMGFNINDRWIMEATLINCIAILRQ